jgi:phage terminase large subunit-like protein
MTGNKKGRQTPTTSFVLEYETSLGQEAVELYNRTKRTAQEWQAQMMYDIMAINSDGLWTHTKFGYSVPRRNGKSELLLMRELWGLQHGERILHTAHRTTTSRAHWEKLCSLLSDSGLVEKENYRTIKQFGLERIEMLSGAGKINFRTRSSKGGLGEGYDLLIIDEAQEYQDDQETALKYVVTDSSNPQTIMCGTPPTPVSSGTVFLKLRKATLAGARENSGWAEWSVEEQHDPQDKDAWYETNPSLGTIFTERSVYDEIGEDQVDFNIQRLGLWLRYNQKSAISKREWKELEVSKLPELRRKAYIGVKYGHDGANVAMSIAVSTADGRIFVECIDCRPVRDGTAWMLPYLKNTHVKTIVIDGANGQQLLANAMKDAKMRPPILPTVKEIILANAAFEQNIYSQHICHSAQPSLEQVVANCEKRSIGSNGGFGYKSIKAGAEIALLDSVILAAWACGAAKETKTQRIMY